MKTLISRVFFLGMLVVCVSAFAQDVTIDALSASPDNFKLLLENDEVRVLEYSLQPGAKDKPHTHPPKVSYVVAGGTLKITTGEGKSFSVQEKAGAASWMGSVGWHYVENTGKTTVRVVLVEVKRASPE
jgi:quercetin dioxygenase-like cupin family protein